jgi:site-specific DNA-methyltransferase (adenine-specific)
LQTELFEHKSTEYDLPKDVWWLVDKLRVKYKWSDSDVYDYWIPRLKLFFEVDFKWQKIFLSPEKTIKLAAKNKDFTSTTVKRLEREANKVESVLENTDDINEFHRWLSDNCEKDSWDFRQLIYYRRKFVALKKDLKSEWILGDWRDHIHKIEDGSGRLLLIDPPYGMDYQSDRRSDRRKKLKHDRIENDGLSEALHEIRLSIEALIPKMHDNAHVLCFCHWKVERFIVDIMNSLGLSVRGSLIWYKNNAGMGDPFTTFAPQHERIIHTVKGSPILFIRESDVFEASRINTKHHPTEKPTQLLMKLIKCTTTEGELVIDVFGGVGSTHISAKELDRRYWGTEKIEKYYERGKYRLDKCGIQKTIFI